MEFSDIHTTATFVIHELVDCGIKGYTHKSSILFSVQSALVSSKGKKTFQWKITGLLPCSEYLFYVTTDQIGLCFFPEFRLTTTGPYGIATLPTGNNYIEDGMVYCVVVW